MIPSRLLAGVCWLVAGTFCSTLNAQPAGARQQDFLYAVQDGDTIFDIASRYATAKDWQRLVHHNNIPDPRRLTPGTMVRVPLKLVEKDPATARVLYRKGDVQISRRDLAVQGAVLEPGTAIQTGADGYLSLELGDGTTVLVLPNARLQIEQVTEFRRAGLQDFVIVLEQGQVEPNVDPAGRGVGRFEIRTPRAVTGVRGTQFRLGMDASGLTGEVLKGEVEMQLPQRSGRRITIREGSGLGASDQGIVEELLLPGPAIRAEVEPGFGAVLVRFDPLPDAVAYRVQLARDARFTQVLESYTTTVQETTFPDLEDGHYYLRVRGISHAGIEGHETVAQVFVAARPVPPLTYDMPRTASKPVAVEAAWATVPTASAYDVEWWPAGSADAPRRSVRVPAGTTTLRLQSAQVLWRVRTVTNLPDGSATEGPWSDARQAKAAGSSASSPSMVSWRVRRGMRGEIEISTSPAFEGSPVFTARTDGSAALPPLPDGQYFIRHRYIDGAGALPPYSPPQGLRIGLP